MAKAEIIKMPVEKISGEIKRSAWWSVLESLAILVLGILFVAWPDTMIKIVAYIVGTFFIVKGLFQIINYFIEQGQRDFFNNNLLSGVISALIGAVAFIVGADVVNIFRIIVGIFLIYEALVKMNIAIKFHAVGIEIWRYVLILALVILALGIFVTANDVATIIGWLMVLAGIISIVSDTLYVQYVNKLTEVLTGHTPSPSSSDASKNSNERK